MKRNGKNFLPFYKKSQSHHHVCHDDDDDERNSRSACEKKNLIQSYVYAFVMRGDK